MLEEYKNRYATIATKPSARPPMWVIWSASARGFNASLPSKCTSGYTCYVVLRNPRNRLAAFPLDSL
jgi:hypothetical protein